MPGTRRKLQRKVKRHPESIQDDDGGRSYEVEKILDKYVLEGQAMYLVKWKGYLPIHNQWVEAEQLDCPDLLEEFEDRRKEKMRKPITENYPNGLVAETILAASEPSTGKGLFFLVKWKEDKGVDFVIAKLAYIHFPEVVQAFHDRRMAFHSCQGKVIPCRRPIVESGESTQQTGRMFDGGNK